MRPLPRLAFQLPPMFWKILSNSRKTVTRCVTKRQDRQKRRLKSQSTSTPCGKTSTCIFLLMVLCNQANLLLLTVNPSQAKEHEERFPPLGNIFNPVLEVTVNLPESRGIPRKVGSSKRATDREKV
jgi:hypothetical protein